MPYNVAINKQAHTGIAQEMTMSDTMTKAQAIEIIEEHWTAITYGTSGRVKFIPNQGFFNELWVIEEQLQLLGGDSVIETGERQ